MIYQLFDCRFFGAGLPIPTSGVRKGSKDFLNFFSLEEKKQKNRTEIFLLK